MGKVPTTNTNKTGPSKITKENSINNSAGKKAQRQINNWMQRKQNSSGTKYRNRKAEWINDKRKRITRI